jgi:hypothetical protein
MRNKTCLISLAFLCRGFDTGITRENRLFRGNNAFAVGAYEFAINFLNIFN